MGLLDQQEEMPQRVSEQVRSVLALGAAVSVIQSVLFVVIGGAALALGVDRLIELGFSGLSAVNLTAFRILCVSFVAIAILGLAITPAERDSVAGANPALAGFGASLAYLGHAGTIAYFSWWLLRTLDGGGRGPDVDELAPIEWGVMFELVFVGAWVWIIADLAHGDAAWPRWFVILSVLKGTAFWFTFGAFLVGTEWMLVAGLGAVTFAVGPLWHLGIARLFWRWNDLGGVP